MTTSVYGDTNNSGTPIHGADNGTPIYADGNGTSVYGGVGGGSGIPITVLAATGNTYDASNRNTTCSAIITRKSNGTEWVFLDQFDQELYSYSAGSAFNITTLTEESDVFTKTLVATAITGTMDVSGSRFYVCASNGRVYQYLSNWSLGSWSGPTQSRLITAQDTQPRGIVSNSVEDVILIAGNENKEVYQFDWGGGAIVNAVYSGNSVPVSEYLPEDAELYQLSSSSDGTILLLATSAGILRLNLSVGYDLTSFVDAELYSVSAEAGTDVRAVELNAAKTRLYVVSAADSVVYEYTLP